MDGRKNDLRPPQVVSRDGREIWDWASRLSDAAHRASDARQLRREIAVVGTTCGDCYLWMKRGSCPKEKGVMVGGPSSGTFKCSQFVEKAEATQRREQKLALLAALAKDGE